MGFNTVITKRGVCEINSLKLVSVVLSVFVLSSVFAFAFASVAEQSSSGGGIVPPQSQNSIPPRMNIPPRIVAEPKIPATIKLGQEVKFRLQAIDADNDGLAWGVSWGDGTIEMQTCPLSPGAGKTFTASHSWRFPRTYTVQVQVRDCRGGSDSTSYKVVVGLSLRFAPNLAISEKDISVSPSSPVAGEEVVFEIVVRNIGNSYTKDYSFSYDFGDGIGVGSAVPLRIPPGGSRTESLKHVYKTAGDYTATFTASTTGDFNMANDKASKKVTVAPSTPPPLGPDVTIILLTLTPANPEVGDFVNFTATARNIGTGPTTNLGFGYAIQCPSGGIEATSSNMDVILNPLEDYVFTFGYIFKVAEKCEVTASISTTGDINLSNNILSKEVVIAKHPPDPSPPEPEKPAI